MTDFLLELRSEEIPARMQDKARDDLARLFAAELEKAGLRADAIVTFATPRRLALIARDLPDQTGAVSEEVKGPRVGAPPQALEGFLRKTGLTAEQLVERDGVLFAVIDKPGRGTADVLAEAIPAIVRAFPWPKSMRWGAASASTESLRWVRPLHGIVALLGEDVVPVEIAGVQSGAATVGHRFHHPGIITIGSAADYAEKLRACHVIVDQDERRAIIRERAAALAAEAGLDLVADEGLVAENAGLTEWPVALLGRFDAAFLEVPPEVIQLTARVNQKYFVCRDGAGKLANAFVCTANIDAADGGAAIVEGNRKVLAARLSDARFFYDTDLKVPLEEQAKKLGKIVFHEKLGTVADKVERVAKLARWLVEEGIVKSPSPLVGEGRGPLASASGKGEGDSANLTPPHPSEPPALPPSPTRGEGNLAALAERAARLCKADLVSGMVGEFPELQGVMGGYYATRQGEDPAVAAAVRDHYKPVGQGDDVPTAPVTVAVSLADKLDTFVSFFSIDQRPTGSKDPFALRRAALGIVRLMIENGIRWRLSDLVRETRANLIDMVSKAGAVVSIDEEVPYSTPVPVYPAAQQRAMPGDVFLISADADAETFITEGGVGYPAYSRAYLEELQPAPTRYGSLVDVVGNSVSYLADRIVEAQKADGIRSDLIRSVIPREFLVVDLLAVFDDEASRKSGDGVVRFRKRNWSSSDDPLDIIARVRALQSFVGTEDGANLLAGYKRAANILRKEGWATETPSPLRGEGRGEGQSRAPAPDTAPLPPSASPRHPLPGGGREKTLSYTPEKAETELIAALDAAEPAAADAVGREDFEAAMAALATLRVPIDAFFDNVTVNDPVPDKRTARLALLARVRDAVHGVADFSKIEG